VVVLGGGQSVLASVVAVKHACTRIACARLVGRMITCDTMGTQWASCASCIARWRRSGGGEVVSGRRRPDLPWVKPVRQAEPDVHPAPPSQSLFHQDTHGTFGRALGHAYIR